jgi:hypothetical protein
LNAKPKLSKKFMDLPSSWTGRLTNICVAIFWCVLGLLSLCAKVGVERRKLVAIDWRLIHVFCLMTKEGRTDIDFLDIELVATVQACRKIVASLSSQSAPRWAHGREPSVGKRLGRPLQRRHRRRFLNFVVISLADRRRYAGRPPRRLIVGGSPRQEISDLRFARVLAG